ncbi:segregation/condensation protein A [Rhizobiaceae bacterium BDR2-2]|uniref:Segregation and condensation protein A n=1 Tax=Ectorhizobium quercum TaxID=2965071 RepID=A0AAE3MZ23_9HYPH|nr:ScpA family protein [Ectorhizobium quercum]MCX8997564.1 segregation/condensation protein A [Ectorhizobium quercum]
MAESRSIPMDKLWSDETVVERGVSEPALVIDVAGFEGPLDLLLHLARSQKVDLSRISVLALAEQYLEFVESARRVRLELAADYLVMAAWLAYLKSRLLIPQQKNDDEPSGEEMAATLAFRLKRLEAMREVAAKLMARSRLGVDVFARGMPEHIPGKADLAFDASLFDLLSAYANLRQRQAITQVTIARREVWSLADAREILLLLLGEDLGWTSLDRYLARYMTSPEDRATAIASSFAASLELVREGRLEIRQDGAFGEIYMRAGTARADARPETGEGADGDR